MQERGRSRASASTISGKPVGEVVARPAVELDAVAALAGDYAEAVVLDLVQPLIAARRLRGRGGQAWRDEAYRQGTRMGEHE
jgi:hypothetical protein